MQASVVKEGYGCRSSKDILDLKKWVNSGLQKLN